MSALTADRNTLTKEGRERGLPVASGKVIRAGSLVVLSAAGYAEPGVTATTVIAVGRAEGFVDNSAGGDGAQTVRVRRGIFAWDNSAAGDAISRANIGATVYVVDDHTVALTNGTNTRSAAGRVYDVDADGVWVETL